jgi:hypothetical protein
MGGLILIDQCAVMMESAKAGGKLIGDGFPAYGIYKIKCVIEGRPL